MGFAGFARACRVGLLAGVAVLASPAFSLAYPSLAAPSVRQVEQDEPFGRSASLLQDGGLRTKWRGVEREVVKEREMLATCRADRVHCPSEAALRFLAIAERAHSRDGLARFGQAVWLLSSLAIAANLVDPEPGGGDVRRRPVQPAHSDATDVRPCALLLATSALSGGKLIAMWGYPLRQFLGL